MPRAHSVVLPSQAIPRFPDRCPFSGQSNPGSSVRVISRDGSAGHAFWAGWFSITVPCVPSRRFWVHVQRLWLFVRTVFIGIGACAFAALYLFAGYTGAARGWLSFGFTVLCIIVLVLWEQHHPPAFTVFVHSGQVHYDFRDRAYAEEFAVLNGVSPISPNKGKDALA